MLIFETSQKWIKSKKKLFLERKCIGQKERSREMLEIYLGALGQFKNVREMIVMLGEGVNMIKTHFTKFSKYKF